MWVFIRSNTLLHCNFLFCIFLLYRTDFQVEVQNRILLKDKYEIMLKMQTPAITLWIPGKCLSHFFIIEKQQINLYIKRFQHSICISLIQNKTNTEISFSFCSDKHSFTLYPSFSPYGQTDWRRLKYTCFTWAGRTFFPVVLCQFLVLAGNRFWLTYSCT